jgi:DNA-binding MarR family transcriptional regulator
MEQKTAIARRLLGAFMQFRKVHWQPSPIAKLKLSELVVLGCIQKWALPEEGLRMSEISGHLKLATPTVTELVNRLVKNGYVLRRRDLEDRRAVRVQLTESGSEAIMQAQTSFLESFVGLVEHLGPEKSNQLTELLTEVFAYYDQFNEVEMKAND